MLSLNNYVKVESDGDRMMRLRGDRNKLEIKLNELTKQLRQLPIGLLLSTSDLYRKRYAQRIKIAKQRADVMHQLDEVDREMQQIMRSANGND